MSGTPSHAWFENQAAPPLAFATPTKEVPKEFTNPGRLGSGSSVRADPGDVQSRKPGITSVPNAPPEVPLQPRWELVMVRLSP